MNKANCCIENNNTGQYLLAANSELFNFTFKYKYRSTEFVQISTQRLGSKSPAKYREK